jgi:hypothetical protein
VWLVVATARSLWQAALAGGRAVRSLARTARSNARRLLDGPVSAAIRGPVRTALLGRRLEVSLVALLLAPVLAVGTAWWVASTVGFTTLEQWVRGTWTGTNPSLAVFVAVALLVALGAVSAGVNSGLLPTSALVAAPVFGAAVTRYGTTVAHTWGTTVVSLPNAVGVAALVAVAVGGPIGLSGFLVGAALRRVVAVLRRGAGPAASPENA